MESILAAAVVSRLRTHAVADGFAQMAKRASGGARQWEAVSPRTELFWAMPDAPMAWLLRTFPTYFQNSVGEAVPLAAHHENFGAGSGPYVRECLRRRL
jgi:hypothetical protein